MNIFFPILMFTVINAVLMSAIVFAKQRKKDYIVACLISVTLSHVIYFCFVMSHNFSTIFLPYFKGIIRFQ